MKKTVLILLATFLVCSLIIFSAACENHQEQPAMQIELAVNSTCRVENAAGQILTFRNGAWEGDMAASSVSVNGFDDDAGNSVHRGAALYARKRREPVFRAPGTGEHSAFRRRDR